MVDFFKELEKAAKHLDKIAKEWEPKNKSPKEQKITPVKGFDLRKYLSIDEVVEAHGTGKLQEVFGAGTAAVVSPVGELMYGEEVLSVGDGSVGPVSQKLYDAITDIQYGKADDPADWIEQV